MAPLFGLVYVSTLARSLSARELDALVNAAWVRNAEEGVTSVLLLANGGVMQYLEGPVARVDSVCASIRRDRRHDGMLEMLREPIRRREFPGWPMAFRSMQFVPDPAGGSAWRPLGLMLSPSPDRVSAARLLLSTFWQTNRPSLPY